MPNRYLDFFASLDDHALRSIQAKAEHRTARAEQGSTPAPTNRQTVKVSEAELRAIAQHATPARFPLATSPRPITE